MSDLETLQAQLAALAAQVAALTPAAPPPVVPMAVPHREEPRPTPIYTLVGSPEMGRLHRDPREVRRLVEAVALAHGVLSPAQHVPRSWVPELHALAAARASGLSWREALAEAGLEVESDLETQAQAVRRELADLWDRLLPLTGMVLDSVNSTVKIKLTAFLTRVLT